MSTLTPSTHVLLLRLHLGQAWEGLNEKSKAEVKGLGLEVDAAGLVQLSSNPSQWEGWVPLAHVARVAGVKPASLRRRLHRAGDVDGLHTHGNGTLWIKATLAHALCAGVPARKIASALGVSPSEVGHALRCLKLGLGEEAEAIHQLTPGGEWLVLLRPGGLERLRCEGVET